MNNQFSTARSILYAVVVLLAITVALFVGVIAAKDSIAPGAVVSLALMITAFAVGYALGRFIAQVRNRRKSTTKNNDLLPEGIGLLALGLIMCGLASGAFVYCLYRCP
jgi:hypothetical protein